MLNSTFLRNFIRYKKDLQNSDLKEKNSLLQLFLVIHNTKNELHTLKYCHPYSSRVVTTNRALANYIPKVYLAHSDPTTEALSKVTRCTEFLFLPTRSHILAWCPTFWLFPKVSGGEESRKNCHHKVGLIVNHSKHTWVESLLSSHCLGCLHYRQQTCYLRVTSYPYADFGWISQKLLLRKGEATTTKTEKLYTMRWRHWKVI